METLQNFINGAYVPSSSETTTPVMNPATGEAYALSPVSNADDVDKAMKAASSAFVLWKKTTPAQRQLALLKIADLIEASAELLIDTDAATQESPRP
jgi:betaine-aldehyde dehydrogenase